MPTEVRDLYLRAFTNSMSTVFLVGTSAALCGFVLSWFIKELPLRETVTTGDLGDTFATPRDTDSLSVAISKIGRMERQESAREIVRRVARRAGVDLQPASCWLLARSAKTRRARSRRSPSDQVSIRAPWSMRAPNCSTGR